MCALILFSLTFFKSHELLGAETIFILVCFTAEHKIFLLVLPTEQGCVRKQKLSPIIIFVSKKLDLLCDVIGNKMQECIISETEQGKYEQIIDTAQMFVLLGEPNFPGS